MHVKELIEESSSDEEADVNTTVGLPDNYDSFENIHEVAMDSCSEHITAPNYRKSVSWAKLHSLLRFIILIYRYFSAPRKLKILKVAKSTFLKFETYHIC